MAPYRGMNSDRLSCGRNVEDTRTQRVQPSPGRDDFFDRSFGMDLWHVGGRDTDRRHTVQQVDNT